MNWADLLKDIESINDSVIMNAIPHKYLWDASEYSVKECLDWIKTNHEESFPEGLIPIYGGHEIGNYEGSAMFLLIEPATGKFWEIHGSHCS